jgi:hypothetical protein
MKQTRTRTTKKMTMAIEERHFQRFGRIQLTNERTDVNVMCRDRVHMHTQKVGSPIAVESGIAKGGIALRKTGEERRVGVRSRVSLQDAPRDPRH